MSELPQNSPSEIHASYLKLHESLSSQIKGQEKTLHYILACYFTGHHVLLEDYPGTGKTTLAKALSHLIPTTRFKRVQFTPDLLPSDLTGVNIFNPSEKVFQFHKGPLFCDILLADEINRASPRTQSALLEAMAEKQVTIEGVTYPLDEHFFVIATQNPVEFRGTYPLPEAQMDRFGLQCSLGYLSSEEEKDLLDDYLSGSSSLLSDHTQKQELSAESLQHLPTLIKSVHVSEVLKDYLIDLISQSRKTPEIHLPLSPRATLALISLAQALAFFKGKDFVTADHIKELAPLVLSHRLLLSNPSQNTTEGKQAYINTLLENTRVPG